MGGNLPSQAVVNDNLLIISDIRVEDAGLYECTADNRAGQVFSQVQLNVAGNISSIYYRK